MIRIEKAPVATHDVDLARLGHAGEAAGELLDHAFLEPAQLVDVDLRRRVLDAVAAQRLHFVHHRRRVQQRLRRDAADIETDTTQRRIALDQYRLHAEVGGAERGRVAAGPRTQHQHLAFDVGAAGVRGGRRGWRHCGGGRRCGTVRRRCGRRRTFHTRRQRQDEAAFRHLVAELDLEFRNRASHGRRHVHRSLVGLERDQRVLGLHRIARLHEHFDDRNILEVADVRYAHVDGLVHSCRTVIGRGRTRGRGMAAFLDLLARRDTRRRGVGVDREDQRAFGYLVAELDLDVLDYAIDGRRYFHRCLVGLERNERILGLHRVTRLHEHPDDRDVLEVADVGDFDFDCRCHSLVAFRSARGACPRAGCRNDC